MSTVTTPEFRNIVCGVIPHDGKVLVTKFTDAFTQLYGFRYATPGGRIVLPGDPNPPHDVNPQRALARELHEQLGIRPWVGPLIAETMFQTHGARVVEQVMYFWCFVDPSVINTSFSSDSSKYEGHEWVPVPDLDKYGTHSHPLVREALTAMYQAQYG
jgi:8-oxo-dGTP pyrophosphatase MutT (NUDIX family)